MARNGNNASTKKHFPPPYFDAEKLDLQRMQLIFCLPGKMTHFLIAGGHARPYLKKQML
jgi:hypothetical protein